MTPYELVREHYRLPFELYPFQVEAVNMLAPRDRSGLWLDMGTGKTIVSIVMALYKMCMGQVTQCVVLMPPILLKNWSRTLDSIGGTTHTVYRGTPKQRAEMHLTKMFTLMSYQIFCKDNERLVREFWNLHSLLICDESTMAKNVATITYKKVRDWSLNSNLMLLSGSPLSSPADGYAPIKLIAPMVYRNLSQYECIHIKSRDHFNNPTEWQNLDLLNSNLLTNAVRVLKTDVIKDLPPVTYSPMFYELDQAHAKTYERLCAEQILKFSNGEKLDLTNASALFHALQQIPLNREVYTQNEGILSTGVELIEETLAELGSGKLVVFTAYRATNRMLLKKLDKYNVVAVYGEVSAAQQEVAIDRFIDDPACRVILLQLKSGGFGIDRLQSVCSDVLFAEMPLVPAHFHQAVARVWRAGQSSPVNVRVSIAENTIQVRLWDVLQDKDSLVNLCIRGLEDLRDALAGLCQGAPDAQNLTADAGIGGEMVDADGDESAVAGPTTVAAERLLVDANARTVAESAAIAPPSITHSSARTVQASPIDRTALENTIATVEASLPTLATNAATTEKAWQDASVLFMKRITLENDVEKASETLKNAKAQVKAFFFAATLAVTASGLEAAKSNLERAVEHQTKSEQDFTNAERALAAHESPNADTILELAEAKDNASLSLNAAKCEISFAESEMNRLPLA